MKTLQYDIGSVSRLSWIVSLGLLSNLDMKDGRTQSARYRGRAAGKQVQVAWGLDEAPLPKHMVFSDWTS